MHPTTDVSRLSDKQSRSREELDALLDTTPLAVVAFIRDGHPAALPIGFARLGDEVVIHGSTGSPWLRALSAGAPVAVCVTALEGVVVARSGFESSFHYRSAVIYGSFERVADDEKVAYLQALTDTFIPGRAGELRASTTKELAATMVLRMALTTGNWSLKIGDGWPDDPPADVAAGAWAGVVPILTRYGEPVAAPDCDPATPLPASVRAMTGPVLNRRGR